MNRSSVNASLSAIMALAAILIALTWLGTLTATSTQRAAAERRIEGELANQAAMFAREVQTSLLYADQTLRLLAQAWEANPGRFHLQSWRGDLALLNTISPDLFITDEHGIIRDAMVPEAVGTDINDQDYFRALAGRIFDDGKLFVSPSTLDPLVRPWHVNLARPLHQPDGSFAGVIVTALRLTVVSDFYREANIGAHGVVAMVGLDQGHLRFALGLNPIDPGTSVSNSDMFSAMSADPNAVWVGRTALDGVERVHGFHRVGDRDIAVVVGIDRGGAMETTEQWIFATYLLAGVITVLLLLLTAFLVRAIRTRQRLAGALGHERAVQAAASTELELARARADEKSTQLEATLATMSEGVAILDRNMRLVQWNRRFSTLTGATPAMLRPGAPVAEIVGAQARAGLRGDADAEMRMVSEGRVIEFRRRRLPDGGFVMVGAEVAGRHWPSGTQVTVSAVLSFPRLEELRATLPAEALTDFVAKRLFGLSERLTALREAVRQQAPMAVVANAHAIADLAAECGMTTLQSRARGLIEAVGSSPDALGPLTEDLEIVLSRSATALREAFHIEMV